MHCYIEKIESKYKLIDFVNLAKENPKILEEYFEKEEIKQLEKVLQEKDKKNKEIKREFMLKCKEPNGIVIIKKMLKGYEGITYLGSSKFSVKRTSSDLKKLDSEITTMFETFEKVAKKEKCDFQVLRN